LKEGRGLSEGEKAFLLPTLLSAKKETSMGRDSGKEKKKIHSVRKLKEKILSRHRGRKDRP